MVCGTIIAALRTNTIQLIFVSFKDHAFGVISKNSSTNTRSPRFYPVYFPWNYKVFYFTFKYDPFWVDFVKYVTSVPQFNILHVDIHLFHNHLLKQPFFLKLPLYLCQKSVNFIYEFGLTGRWILRFFSAIPFLYLMGMEAFFETTNICTGFCLSSNWTNWKVLFITCLLIVSQFYC